jgi:hypothetical protein
VTDDLDNRWRPLSLRESGDYAAYDALHPGVPRWLQTSLWAWVERRIEDGNPNVSQIQRVLRVELDRPARRSVIEEIRVRAFRDSHFFLDLVDYVASKLSLMEDPKRAARTLTQMLDEAGSEWTLDYTLGRYGLVRRVPPETQAAAERVMSTSDKAAQHLRIAWHAVYGRQPDPSKGYGEAIKAMEVVTIPVVCPANPRATLGRVIKDLKAKPGKWAVNLKHPDPERQVETVADMLDLIWKGQSDRHGDPDPDAPISVTQEQAEAAVHLAVTVVQWFNTRAVITR